MTEYCICGKELPRGNMYCCIACYRRANEEILEIEVNLHVGGDLL